MGTVEILGRRIENQADGKYRDDRDAANDVIGKTAILKFVWIDRPCRNHADAVRGDLIRMPKLWSAPRIA